MGAKGTVLVQPAYDSFIHAMHVVASLSAGVTLIGALLAWFFLPGKVAAPGHGQGAGPADAANPQAVPVVESTKA